MILEDALKFIKLVTASKDDTRVLVPPAVTDYALEVLKTLKDIEAHLSYRNAQVFMSSTVQCKECFIPVRGKDSAVVVWYPASAEQCPGCGAANPLAVFGERYGR